MRTSEAQFDIPGFKIYISRNIKNAANGNLSVLDHDLPGRGGAEGFSIGIKGDIFSQPDRKGFFSRL